MKILYAQANQPKPTTKTTPLPNTIKTNQCFLQPNKQTKINQIPLQTKKKLE
jgi:hypothetical protein